MEDFAYSQNYLAVNRDSRGQSAPNHTAWLCIRNSPTLSRFKGLPCYLQTHTRKLCCWSPNAGSVGLYETRMMSHRSHGHGINHHSLSRAPGKQSEISPRAPCRDFSLKFMFWEFVKTSEIIHAQRISNSTYVLNIARKKNKHKTILFCRRIWIRTIFSSRVSGEQATVTVY